MSLITDMSETVYFTVILRKKNVIVKPLPEFII